MLHINHNAAGQQAGIRGRRTARLASNRHEPRSTRRGAGLFGRRLTFLPAFERLEGLTLLSGISVLSSNLVTPSATPPVILTPAQIRHAYVWVR